MFESCLNQLSPMLPGYKPHVARLGGYSAAVRMVGRIVTYFAALFTHLAAFQCKGDLV